jgi:hypothetical protein
MQAPLRTCRSLRYQYTATFSSKFKEALFCRVSLALQWTIIHFNETQPNSRTDITSKRQHVICPYLLPLSVKYFDFIVIHYDRPP